MDMKKQTTDQKIVSRAGSISGVASVLGSWQICHNICLAIVALLAILGITVVGMPLGFLAQYSVPIWTATFALLLLTLYFFFTKKCISKKLVLFNSGLVIAGIPFQQEFVYLFYTVGAIFAIYAIFLFFKERQAIKQALSGLARKARRQNHGKKKNKKRK